MIISARGRFSSPLMSRRSEDEEQLKRDISHYNLSNPYAKKNPEPQAPAASNNPLLEDERLKGLDPKLIELVCNEVPLFSPPPVDGL